MASPGKYDRVALVTDIRGGQTFDGLFFALEQLEAMKCGHKIVFVEVEGHRLKYQLVDGVVEARGSLSDVQEKLAGHGFLRCNSCYVVNVKYIEFVKGYDLHINGYKLKISHPRRKEFMRQLMDIYAGSFREDTEGG